jgi:hypothetical protein
MTRRCFHLPVASPTNDYGPDFLLVDLTEADGRRIRALWAVLQTTDADGLLLWDRRPDWYRGDPESAAEEILAGGEGLDLLDLLDEQFGLVNVQASRLVVGQHSVYWEAESAGGDLFRTAALSIRELVSGVGLGAESRMSSPLEWLLELVGEGKEFPDTLWQVTHELGLTGPEAEDLKRQYDLACARTPAPGSR